MVSFSAESSENEFLMMKKCKAMCSSIESVDVRMKTACTFEASDIYEHKHNEVDA